MVRNVILRYPNGIKVQVDRLVCYRISSIRKKFLIYTTGEMDNDNVVAYFGELIDHDMVPTQPEDLFELKKLLRSMAFGTLHNGDAHFVSITNELDDETVTVHGGGKTRINREILNTYLESAVVEKEIETLDFSDDDDDIPVDLGKTMILEPITEAPKEDLKATIVNNAPLQPMETKEDLYAPLEDHSNVEPSQPAYSFPSVEPKQEDLYAPLGSTVTPEPYDVYQEEVQTENTPLENMGPMYAPQEVPTPQPTEDLSAPLNSTTEMSTSAVSTVEPTQEVNNNVQESIPEEPKKEKKKKKSSGKTFVIILFVLVLLGVAGFFGYNWIKDNNRKADEKDDQGEKKEDVTSITLEQIGQKLRGLTYITNLEKAGNEVLITYTSSMLDVKVTKEETSEYQYDLEEDSIEVTYAKDDKLGEEITQHVYASIQELLGNDRTEVLKKVQEGFENPTLDKQGISYKEVGVNVTVDLSLKTKLDLSNVDLTGPISEELFASHKDDLTNEKALSLQYGEVFFEKKKENNELVIFIIQKKPITEDAYQTLINYLKVAYGEEKANGFKSQYANFEAEPTTATDYKVSLKGTLAEEYTTKYSRAEYEWVEIRFEG